MTHENYTEKMMMKNGSKQHTLNKSKSLSTFSMTSGPKLSVQDRIVKAKEAEGGKQKSKTIPLDWQQSVAFDDVDEDGFGTVKVMEIFEDIDKSVILYVIPISHYADYINYIESLQNHYDQLRDIVLIREINDKNGIVVTKFNEKWARCRIIEIYKSTKQVGLEDVDTGRKGIFDNTHIIKPAMDEDLQLKSFAFKAIVANNNPPEIAVNEMIKIKIVEIDDDSKISYVQVEEEIEETDTKIDYMPLDEGVQKLFFVSGSDLENQKIDICSASPMNIEFYDEIELMIQQYMENVRDERGLKCKSEDFVLALFSDGKYYRGIVESVSSSSARIQAIDYPLVDNIEFKNLMKMPKDFFFPCISHSCQITLKNGTDPKKIDPIRTQELMKKTKVFKGKVRKIDEFEYEVMIQEKDVVLKN